MLPILGWDKGETPNPSSARKGARARLVLAHRLILPYYTQLNRASSNVSCRKRSYACLDNRKALDPPCLLSALPRLPKLLEEGGGRRESAGRVLLSIQLHETLQRPHNSGD